MRVKKLPFPRRRCCSTNLSQDLTQIYGQTAIFDHFVRNRLFSSRLFTDKEPIFIDVSVNGRAFAKCGADKSAAKLTVKFTARLFWVISIVESDRPAIDCKSSGFLI